MSMDFFLDRRLQAALQAKLRTVPALVEELSVTIAKQARVQKSGLRLGRRQKPGSKLPFHLAASDASGELQNCLAGWVRIVCEERGIDYEGHADVVTLARWLGRNMISLALTQGSEGSHDEIASHVDYCWQLVDLPPDDEVVIDRARVREANRQVLTAGQVEKIAIRLGALGAGLNKRRVETLVDRKRLKPCAVDGDVSFYRLGDVLDAHHSHVSRTRKNAGTG